MVNLHFSIKMGILVVVGLIFPQAIMQIFQVPRIVSIAHGLFFISLFMFLVVFFRSLSGLSQRVSMAAAGHEDIGFSSTMRNDELGRINNSVNTLLEQLKEKNIQLEEYSKDLEKMVEAKTHELQKALDKLTELDSLKDDILSNVSHELKTPITIIQGNIELALREDDPEERVIILSYALEALENQIDIVDDLIAISKMGTSKPQKGPENIEVIVEGEVFKKSKKAKRRGITIETESDAKLPLISFDKHQISHVLRNILDNAIKFSDKDGRVAVMVKREKNGIQVSVSDNGIGIREDQIDRVFEPLTQLDPSTSRRYGGTGTGLAVAKNFIEEHGGRIWVESKFKEGSTFYFTLPFEKLF